MELTSLVPLSGLSPSLLNVMEAVSENECKLEVINTWDDAFMTFGVFQWSIGQTNARGELAALLDRLKDEHGLVIEYLFDRHGLNVVNMLLPTEPSRYDSSEFLLSLVRCSIVAKKGKTAHAGMGLSVLARKDNAVRTVQIKQTMDRLHIFYRSSKHRSDGRLISAYVTSEAGVALLLDQHVNRPRHVPRTLTQPTERLARAPGLPDPSDWFNAEERELLEEYVVRRSGTSMTDSDKRAQIVLDAASWGVISDRRGSFVLDATLV